MRLATQSRHEFKLIWFLIFSTVRLDASGAVLGAKLAGRNADFATESDAEILDVIEGGAFGNLVEGKVGFDEKLFHAIEADAQNFFVRGAADQAFEAALQERARLRDDAQNVFDLNAGAGVLADVVHGAGDVSIFDNEDVGGLARGDAERRNQVRLTAGGFAGDHLVHQRGGFVTGAMHVRNDAGQRRI